MKRQRECCITVTSLQNPNNKRLMKVQLLNQHLCKGYLDSNFHCIISLIKDNFILNIRNISLLLLSQNAS